MAFASDSESDDEPAKKKISIGESVTQKRQARILQQVALKDDPTIFQYDEVYDEISANREEAKKAKSAVNRDSKYINKLLVAAEKRKIEYETRLERKVQKEREAEGDQFKDKEVFVTSSYRQKLEAMKKAEEEAQREEYLESIGDVRKQKDLSGFYRHMYEQKLGNDKVETKSAVVDEHTPEIIKKTDKSNKRRTYRKHNDHENSDDEGQSTSAKVDGPPNKKVHLQSNLDADSDFSIDSDSESDDEKDKKNKENEKNEKVAGSSANTNEEKTPEKNDDEKNSKVEKQTVDPEQNGAEKKEETNGNGEKTDAEKMPPPQEIKPKIDIWKKRTVDDIYLEAVKRYYERKQTAA